MSDEPLVAVAVAVMVMMVVAALVAHPCVRLELLDTPRVQGPRVSARRLETGVRQRLDDGLQVLLGALGGAGQGHDDGLVPHARDGPRHHGERRH